MQMRFHPECAGLHLTYFLFAIFYTIKVILKNCQKYFISVTVHIFFFYLQKPAPGCILQERNLTRHHQDQGLSWHMGSSLCLIIRSCAHTSVPVSDKFTFFTFQENMWNTILFITLVIAKSEMLTLTQSILHFRTPSGHWGQDIDGLSVIFLGKQRSVVYHKLCHFLSSQSIPQTEPQDSG